MSEPENPKRKFWQFHLSTAVILMLCAGLDMMLWYTTAVCVEYDYDEPNVGLVHHYSTDFGFPINFYFRAPLDSKHAFGIILSNLPFNLPIFIIVAFISEWLIRRREGRKP